jgi:hypothetical protein
VNGIRKLRIIRHTINNLLALPIRWVYSCKKDPDIVRNASIISGERASRVGFLGNSANVVKTSNCAGQKQMTLFSGLVTATLCPPHTNSCGSVAPANGTMYWSISKSYQCIIPGKTNTVLC